MAKRRKPTYGHRCQGVKFVYQVSCECGWRTLNVSRAQAYHEWRVHVAEHEAPLLAHVLTEPV